MSSDNYRLRNLLDKKNSNLHNFVDFALPPCLIFNFDPSFLVAAPNNRANKKSQKFLVWSSLERKLSLFSAAHRKKFC